MKLNTIECHHCKKTYTIGLLAWTKGKKNCPYCDYTPMFRQLKGVRIYNSIVFLVACLSTCDIKQIIERGLKMSWWLSFISCSITFVLIYSIILIIFERTISCLIYNKAKD